jgi:hypothetical protein
MRYTKVSDFAVKRTRRERMSFHRTLSEACKVAGVPIISGQPAFATHLGEAPIIFLITM